MASKFSSPKISSNKITLLSPILTDKCLRTHSLIYHLTHPYENCISEDKVCSVDFAKVLRPIKLASNINANEKTHILDIRKRFNNRNAAGAFRKRENDTDKTAESELFQLRAEKAKLKVITRELNREINFYRSASTSYPVRQSEFTDSDSDINITSPMSFDFPQSRTLSDSAFI